VHKLVASLKEDREARLRLEEDLEEMGIHVPCGVKIPLEPDESHQLHEWFDLPQGPFLAVLAFEPW